MTIEAAEAAIVRVGKASEDPWYPVLYLGDYAEDFATIAGGFAALKAKVAELEGERDRLRSMLFPYAAATDICGMSWDGFYLIGDKKSIDKLRQIENTAAQIEVYRRAFEEHKAASEAECERLREALARIERWSGEFPKTDQFWDEEKTRPMSYGAAYGSNGERDFMRYLARAALEGKAHD